MFFLIHFKLAVYRKSGMEFQNFFSKILGYIDDGFVHVKPYGNWGDGGNDGCNPTTKTYYQIYAPLATTEVNAIQAFKKATTDYGKLLSKWGAVHSYNFVINDRFTGVDALLLNDFEDFKVKESIPNGKIIHSQELTKYFLGLNDDAKLDVLEMSFLPNDKEDFDETALSNLIRFLLNKPDRPFHLLIGKAPDFDEKIKFNNLGENLALRLKSNSLEAYKVDEFFLDDESLSQELSQTVKDIYRNIADSIPDTEPHKGELIYHALVEDLIPSFAKSKEYAQHGYHKVAEIIIAKYFETCDAYEDPNSPSAP